MDWSKLATSGFTGIVGVLLVATSCAESFFHGTTDPAILVLTTGVVATYFTGGAVRQVNGTKVEALTHSVLALHARLDAGGLPPAADGVEAASG